MGMPVIVIVICWLCWLSFVACLMGFIMTGSLVALLGAFLSGYCTYHTTVTVIEG